MQTSKRIRKYRRDTELRNSRPLPGKPMSSHPEADPPSAKPLVTESDVRDYQQDASHRKPIVSINGEDVAQDSPVYRRVA